MKNLVRTFRYLKPYRRLACIVVALIVFAGFADLLGPWPLQVLVDNVLGNHPLSPLLANIFGTVDRFVLLIAAVVAGLVVALLHNGITVINNYYQTMLEQRIVLDFRSEMFQHAQRLSMAFHERRRAGMLIYAINAQGDAVAGLIMTVPTLAQSFLTLIGMFWITYTIDRGLALLSLLVLPFLFYSVRYYATRIQARLMEVRGMEAESLSIVHEAISMLRVIVAFGRENHEYQRFRDQGTKTVNARVGVTVRQTLFSLAVNMTTAVGTALVLGFGAYQAIEGKLTVGELLVVMAYIAAVYQPLESITNTAGTLQDKLANQRIAYDLLDTEPEVKEDPHPIALQRAQGRIQFEHVNFNYKTRVETLKEISFEVSPGQTVAIVGPTGAGKTTLISLLPRFYDAVGGTILIDGIDTRRLKLTDLRNQISLVLQEPLLFSGTIAQNIRYGRLDADDDDIVESARAANAHEFIMKLPKQYETELGERGAQISGGERQRICVARAFLKDAPILILDEPTSAIDSKTEAVILDALDRLMVGRTSFMIAHRLSTIHRSDMILVLDHGRLVEIGTHDELLAQARLYHQLHELQNKHQRRKLEVGSEGSNF